MEGLQSSQRLSLREEAERRAAMNDREFGTSSPETSSYGIDSCVSSGGSVPVASPFHPLEDDRMCSSPSDVAQQARKEWRQYGAGLTQVLEDKRRLQEQQSLHGHELVRSPGTLVVRVVCAEQRVDLSGSKFTSYVIRVQFPNPSIPPEASPSNTSVQVEHRYSDFAKLNSLIKKHDVSLDTSFPGKSWAGRVGNWTPSLALAPEKHMELTSYRVMQLDIWLVHLVEKYNRGQLPFEVAHAVYEFLAAPSKPPCESENDLSQGKWLWNNPFSFTLGSSIRQATKTVQYMTSHTISESDQSIPLDLLQAAKGLCFMTVVKGGMVVSGRIGTGLVVARLNNVQDGSDVCKDRNGKPIQWSSPCAVGTVGVGWGAQVGGDVTHYLIVLTTHEAVQDFCGSASVQLGAELGVAVGPVGRGANSHLATGDWSVHQAYAYAHSQGLFVGMSIEGSVVSVRSDVNAKFYGQAVTAQQLLRTPGPRAAQPLYKALEKPLQAAVPDEGFRPSAFWSKNNQQQRYTSPQNNSLMVNAPPPPMIMGNHRMIQQAQQQAWQPQEQPILSPSQPQHNMEASPSQQQLHASQQQSQSPSLVPQTPVLVERQQVEEPPSPVPHVIHSVTTIESKVTPATDDASIKSGVREFKPRQAIQSILSPAFETIRSPKKF